ncbi:hypothetical protein Tco_0262488 [Tanacetum coccineum]
MLLNRSYLRIAVIMEYLANISKKARILELKRRYFENYYSDNQYAVSIKEDTAYLCMHSPKTIRRIRGIQERKYAVFKLYGNKIFRKISSVVPTPRNSNTPYPTPWIRVARLPSVDRHAYCERLFKLQQKSIGAPRVADWTMFYVYTFNETLKELMKMEYLYDDRDVFVYYARERALSIEEDVYPKWCLEFFSTMYFERGVDRTKLITKKYVWFRLCGQEHVLTLSNFAVLLGYMGQFNAPLRNFLLFPLSFMYTSYEIVKSNARQDDDDASMSEQRVHTDDDMGSEEDHMIKFYS